MECKLNTSTKPTYHAEMIRLHTRLDWYLRSALLPEREEKSWSLEEIQDKLRTVTGIKLRKSTILRRNTQFFQQYQCSPLRRVDHERYSLDPVYYFIASEKVRPPPTGPGRPRKKYMQGEEQIDRGA